MSISSSITGATYCFYIGKATQTDIERERKWIEQAKDLLETILVDSPTSSQGALWGCSKEIAVTKIAIGKIQATTPLDRELLEEKLMECSDLQLWHDQAREINAETTAQLKDLHHMTSEFNKLSYVITIISNTFSDLQPVISKLSQLIKTTAISDPTYRASMRRLFNKMRANVGRQQIIIHHLCTEKDALELSKLCGGSNSLNLHDKNDRTI